MKKATLIYICAIVLVLIVAEQSVSGEDIEVNCEKELEELCAKIKERDQNNTELAALIDSLDEEIMRARKLQEKIEMSEDLSVPELARLELKADLDVVKYSTNPISITVDNSLKQKQDGKDKYITLKQRLQGKIKVRLDEFESM